MLLASLTSLLALGGLVSAGPEQPFQFASGAASMRHDMKLLDVQGDYHTELFHSDFPDHRVRIKETTGWCDPDVQSYTGYLDTDSYGKNLFFYFFLSRDKPVTDDVLLWINGGPGCSSATGLFMELGPCSVSDPTSINGTTRNPHSWNTNLNTIFLDQPVGVGLSYAQNGQSVATTEAAAVDVQAFVRIFFDSFKEFRGRAFHISGESYGGRYLPIFASAIIDGNRGLEHPINLKSVIIGNGVTDRFDLTLSHYEQICTNRSGLPPVLSVTKCAAMQAVLPRCEKMMKAECQDRFDAIGCQNALDFCYLHIRAPFTATGLNPYDISKPCEGYLCYGSISRNISAYLSNPSVRTFLGADDPLVPETFEGCSAEVGYLFNSHMDGTGKTYLYVSQLLERGIKVLIYAGKYDHQCNWIHQLRWTSKLEWSHKEAFNDEKIKDWFVDAKAEKAGVAAGETRSYGDFTYATVAGAGHMVPYDKPVEALEMLTRWLAKGKL